MAILNFTGFETGDNAEAAVTSGTFSVQSTTKRTGGYALRVNPASGVAAYYGLRKVGANGKSAVLGIASGTVYATFYVYNDGAANGSNCLCTFAAAAGSTYAAALIYNAATGKLQFGGSSSGQTNGTMYGNVWYRVDMAVTVNGATSCSIYTDAGVFIETVTGTAFNVTIDTLYIGASIAPGAAGQNFYFDDVAISDSAVPGDCAIKVAVPTGDSATNTAWSASAGNKWACVDELPPSATDYIESLTTAGDRRYSATHASCATLSINGPIKAAKVVGVLWEPTSTTTLGAIGIRSGSTNFELSNVDIGTTAEVTLARVDSTDPNTSAAWTISAVDAAEPLVKRSTSDTSNIRCKWLGLMVLSGPTMVSLSGNQAAPSGAISASIIPGGVTVTGAQPAASGTVQSLRYKALAGAQAAPSGTVTNKTTAKLLTGSQAAPSGALTVRRVLTHITLAGAQAAPSGALSAIKKQFKSLAGNQPAGSGALAFDIVLRHITLAGAQPAGSGSIAAVRAKFISLAGNQPSSTGTVVGLFKNKLLQGAQAAPSGSLAFDRLLTHVSLAGAQPAASGAIAAVSATFVDVSGNQAAPSGALVAKFAVKLLQGNQPNATGLLVIIHFAFLTLTGNQPAGSGTVVGVAPVRNYTPSPYGGTARATLQPPGGSGRVTDVRPGHGTVRRNDRPRPGSGRYTP